jgi:hypothetical protein
MVSAAIETATSRGDEIRSFNMKRTAAPFFRSDVGDGFGEVPSVAKQVLSIVLALAIGLVFRLSQDEGSVLSRTLAVTLGILDSDLNDVRVVRRNLSFGDGEATVSGFHLDAVVGNAQTDSKAERLR